VVVHTYNSSYLGSEYQENHGFRPSGQKVNETPISTNKLGKMSNAVIPATREAESGESQFKAGPE
jgi:hypothetical protein